MAHAIALVRTRTPNISLGETMRTVIVLSCGLALALAGPVLPL